MDSPAEDMQRSNNRSTNRSKRCGRLGLFSVLIGALSGPAAALAFFATVGAGDAINNILPCSVFLTMAVIQIASLVYIGLQKVPVRGGGLVVAGFGATCLWFVLLLVCLFWAILSTGSVQPQRAKQAESAESRPATRPIDTNDLTSLLPPGATRVDILDAVYDPETLQTWAKFAQVFRKDPKWILAYMRAKMEEGKPLPYDPKMGVSRQAYEKALAAVPTIVKTGHGAMTVTRNGEMLEISAGGPVGDLDKVRIDLVTRTLETPQGKAGPCKTVAGEKMRNLGPWDGVLWDFLDDHGDEFRGECFHLQLILAVFRQSGRGAIYYKLFRPERDKPSADFRLLVSYALSGPDRVQSPHPLLVRAAQGLRVGPWSANPKGPVFTAETVRFEADGTLVLGSKGPEKGVKIVSNVPGFTLTAREGRYSVIDDPKRPGRKFLESEFVDVKSWRHDGSIVGTEGVTRWSVPLREDGLELEEPPSGPASQPGKNPGGDTR